MAIHHPLTLAFGLLGNIISFMVFLAPIPTFYTIYKKKTTEGFQALLYVVALFSCMLWIYYALLKQDATFLITINSVGCVIETVYLAIFLLYSPKMARISTMKLLLLLNVFGYGIMLVLTLFLAKGEMRLKVVGWICLVFNLTYSVCCTSLHLGEHSSAPASQLQLYISVLTYQQLVYIFRLINLVARLKMQKKVIRTKSVEFMPFPLSFFLTLGAVMWFFYGFLLKDYNIAFPNILGFLFGIAQMVLYIVYKNAKKVVLEEPSKVQELSEHIIEVMKISTMVCPDLTPVVLQPNEIDLIEIVLDPNNIVKTAETKEDVDDASTKG